MTRQYRPAKENEMCAECGSESCVAVMDCEADSYELQTGIRPPKFTLCPYCYETTVAQNRPYGGAMCQAFNLMEQRIVSRLLLEVRAGRKR